MGSLRTMPGDRCGLICRELRSGSGSAAGRIMTGGVDRVLQQERNGETCLCVFLLAAGTPPKKIAVKVIDHRGNEMLEVFDMEEGKF